MESVTPLSFVSISFVAAGWGFLRRIGHPFCQMSPAFSQRGVQSASAFACNKEANGMTSQKHLLTLR